MSDFEDAWRALQPTPAPTGNRRASQLGTCKAFYRQGAADRERELLELVDKLCEAAEVKATGDLSADVKAMLAASIREFSLAARQETERKLRALGPCKVPGHTMADWHRCGYSGRWQYCAACRREQAKDAEIARLRAALEAAPPAEQIIDCDYQEWHRTVRAAALGNE